MMPLLKGNSQASGAITFHIPAIRKLTFSPSLLTFSPFSFSVIHSFFPNDWRRWIWSVIYASEGYTLPPPNTFPSAATPLLTPLFIPSQHHSDFIPPHPFQHLKWTAYTSFIPNPTLFNWVWPRYKSHSHLLLSGGKQSTGGVESIGCLLL